MQERVRARRPRWLRGSIVLGWLLCAACAPQGAPAGTAAPARVAAGPAPADTGSGASAASRPACPPCTPPAPAGHSGPAVLRPIDGFDAAVNGRIAEFLAVEASKPRRKVAVFDGDGTTFGQAPHYLADECLFELAAQQPERKPEIIARMRRSSNVSLPYVQDRVRFLAGMSLDALRELGDRCYREHYPGKVYPGMRSLVAQLGEHGFEVWIITASPEGLYQQFLARELGIPLTNVVGVKSVIRGGIVTDTIVHPVPQDEGKREAIETFVQAKPLVAGGNSRGDREMIELSEGLRIIVNPDEHVAEGDTESMAAYAARMGWLVVRQTDVPPDGFPAISSRRFGIRTNKTHPAR